MKYLETGDIYLFMKIHQTHIRKQYKKELLLRQCTKHDIQFLCFFTEMSGQMCEGRAIQDRFNIELSNHF